VAEGVADDDARAESGAESGWHPLARRTAPNARTRLSRRRMIVNRWPQMGRQPGIAQARTPLRHPCDPRSVRDRILGPLLAPLSRVRTSELIRPLFTLFIGRLLPVHDPRVIFRFTALACIGY
jgi:hypothetical protein